MESKEIQNRDPAKSGESKSSEDLEKALQTFINEADQQKPQTKGRHGKIKDYFSQPKNALDVAGVLILLAYTIVTIGLWISQQTSNGINEQALTDSNRPWIKITIVPNDIIWIASERPFSDMMLSVYAENVGHSPAIHVQSFIGSYFTGSKVSREITQKSTCKTLTNDPVTTDGRVIFPSDKVDMAQPSAGVRGGAGISKSDIDAAPPRLTNNGTQYTFTIFGCADYVFGSQSQHYQTFFSYDVYRIIDHNAPFPRVSAFFNVGESVAAKDIILSPSYDGNDAN